MKIGRYKKNKTKKKIDLGSWSHPIIFSCSSSKHHWQHRPGTDGLASAKKTHDFSYLPSFLPSDPMTPKPPPTLVINTLHRLTHSQLNPVRITATRICEVNISYEKPPSFKRRSFFHIKCFQSDSRYCLIKSVEGVQRLSQSETALQERPANKISLHFSQVFSLPTKAPKLPSYVGTTALKVGRSPSTPVWMI